MMEALRAFVSDFIDICARKAIHKVRKKFNALMAASFRTRKFSNWNTCFLQRKNACTSHKIEARDLYNLVLKDIQELAEQAMKDADAFYQRLSSRMERRYLVDASQTEKERKRLEARNQEIDGMFLNLYTDKAKGILTEQRFMKLTAALEQEQEANQKRLHDLAVMQSRADAQESEVRTFIKEIRRYAAIEELDEAVLNRLISRILIGEVKKVDGQKVQEVRIVYNFVGEIPEIAA